MQLFRPEAIDHQRRRLLGDVIIIQPVKFTILTMSLIVISCIIIFISFLLNPVENETLHGSLVHESKKRDIIARSNGEIDQLLVDQGMIVEQGATLAIMRQYSPDTSRVSESHAVDTEGEIFTKIVSTLDGMITRVNVQPGDNISENQPLLEIRERIPSLSAELVVPPRLLASITVGQSIEMHYQLDDVIHEQVHRGAIEKISANLSMPGQWIGSVQLIEPAYKASVRLEEQDILVDNQLMRLRPGMTLQVGLLQQRASPFDSLMQ